MRFSSFTWVFAAAFVTACGDDSNNATSTSTGTGGSTSSGTPTTATGAGTTTSGSTTGTTSTGTTATGATTSGATTSGTGAGGEGGAPPMGPCPTAPPTDGSACPTDGLDCSWGTDARYGCRIAAVCNAGLWSRFPATGTWNCPAPEPQCPIASPGGGDGCTDAELGLTCIYDGAAYTCANCNGNLCFTSNSWFESDVDVTCPDAPLPNLGDPCTMDGLECDYNHCSDDQEMSHGWVHGVAIACNSGTWALAMTGFCP